MPIEKEKIEQVQNLRQYLPEKTQEELDEILEYGEKIKAEGERKKKKFWDEYALRKETFEFRGYWDNHKEELERENFLKLLRYKCDHQEELEKKYKYLDKMNRLEKEKFIEEYLYDDMLYGCDFTGGNENVERAEFDYNAWKNGDVVMKKGIALNFCCSFFRGFRIEEISGIQLENGVSLNLRKNFIGDGGAETISQMELKEGVELNLQNNHIGDEGAKAISKMELKEGVKLDLSWNKIGDGGAQAIAKNMRLKEGVELNLKNNYIGTKGAKAISKMELKEGIKLDLSWNKIGDEGAKAIIDNIKLKDGVWLDLKFNDISENMRKALKDWIECYKKKGINCIVLF